MARTQDNQRRWTRAEERLLGTKPDAEVAALLGRTRFAVQLRRHSLGIPARYEDRSAWSPEEDKLVGTLPDTEVARILGRSIGSVKARRLARTPVRMRPGAWTQ